MQPSGRARTRQGLVALALAGGWVLALCGPASAAGHLDRVAPVSRPGAPRSCASVAARPAGAAGASAPVTVMAVPGGRLALARVCIGRAGPFAFVVGTGSPRSAIDAELAARLHLALKATVALGGSGCATAGRLVKVPAMRIGPIAIDGQSMVRSSLTSWSGRRVDGVLGSDVWGRFGALRLDLVGRTLTVATSEGPAPSSHAFVEGKAGVAPPADVALATPGFSAPLTVVEAPGSIAPFVQVTVAESGPYAFALDTGSPSSSLSATVGFTLRLPDQGTAGAPGGIGCRGVVPTLVPTQVGITSPGPAATSGTWERTLALRATVLPGPSAPGPQRSGMVGSLGLDVVGAEGALVVDYTDATLTMGAA